MTYLNNTMITSVSASKINTLKFMMFKSPHRIENTFWLAYEPFSNFPP